MNKKAPYTFEELLENEDFISFVHHPAKENTAYWNHLIRKGMIDRDEYRLAHHCIRRVADANAALSEDELKDIWVNVRIGNRKNARRRRLYLFASGIAASLLIGGSILFQQVISENAPIPAAAESNIENVSRPDVTGNDIQIVLSGNNSIALKDNNTEIKYNDKGEAEVNSKRIEESVDQATDQAKTFNQVIIPKGKFTSLVLSDGTKLWLNSASRVVYPPVFDDTKREIYIEGEAYMDVTPDKSRPFIVKTKQMEVRVMGTSFNISAYEEERAQTVVLVSGLVSIKTKGNNEVHETTLTPDHLFCLAGEKEAIKKVDVNHFISWKEGYYIYKSETLSHIFNRLSNYYGVEIEYDDAIGSLCYSGKMDLKEDIGRVLDGLCFTAPIKYHEENDKHYLCLTTKNESPME